MSAAPAKKPNRTLWIIAGVLGCLVVCLLIAFVTATGYFMLGWGATPVAKSVSTSTPTRVPFGVSSTNTAVPFPTQTPVAATLVAVVPTAVTSSTTAPTIAPPTAVTTVRPAATKAPAATSAAAPTGKIVFSRCEDICDLDDKKTVWVMNADGSGAKKILTRASEPSLSPDGKKVAYYHWSDGIFVANIDGTDPVKVVGDTNVGFIDWSHDGRWIAFSAQPGGKGNIVIDVVPPDGSALKDSQARRNITVGISPSWSPDDAQFVFSTCRSSCGIFKSSSAPGSEAIPLTSDDGGAPSWAPDGKRMVYQKEVEGQKQLFLINADGSGARQLTSGTAMHVSAVWSSDGRFIFYRSPQGGPWAIWRINADGTNPIKIIDDVPPSPTWAYERLGYGK